MKTIGWSLLILLCILIGVYPLISILADGYIDLLEPKNSALFSVQLYSISFYIHITLGGLALTVGWIQFFSKIRISNMSMHRSIGKFYILSVLISAITGLYIAVFAYGGIIASLGFIGLAFAWFYTTFAGFRFALLGKIPQHQRMMSYSYAVTLAAITFRVLLPILSSLLDSYLLAYQISADK